MRSTFVVVAIDDRDVAATPQLGQMNEPMDLATRAFDCDGIEDHA